MLLERQYVWDSSQINVYSRKYRCSSRTRHLETQLVSWRKVGCRSWKPEENLDLGGFSSLPLYLSSWVKQIPFKSKCEVNNCIFKNKKECTKIDKVRTSSWIPIVWEQQQCRPYLQEAMARRSQMSSSSFQSTDPHNNMNTRIEFISK